MTQDRDPIVITPEELNTPEVERTLARLVSFGMGAPPERVDDARTGLLFRPWFALMLAGAVGALVAWALVEPFFTDGIEVRGTVERWAPDGVVALEHGRVVGLGQVSGVEVWCLEGATRVTRGRERLTQAAIEDGSKVRLEAEMVPLEEGGVVLFASEIELLDPSAVVPAKMDLPSAVQWSAAVGFLIFPLVAGLVGLFIGACDGLLSRATHRALVCGGVGLGVGIAVGLGSGLVAQMTYAGGNALVERLDTPELGLSTSAFLVQMINRGLAWSLAGAAMGLGQGIALRSRRLLLNGLIGGMAGGLLGGLLFDPIGRVLGDVGGAEASRCIGFMAIGATTGFMIGIVELMARDAWIKMLTGPLAGKEFVIYRDPTVVGSSPKTDIYLFKDAEVEPTHALIRTLGEGYEIEDQESEAGLFVNGRRVRRHHLSDGDQVRIGQTVLAFSQKEG